ncbi:MAG: DUF1573 domain-containing protein [Paludibacteraceae bacterium]
MKRILIVSLMMSACCFALLAQRQTECRFVETEYDFGRVREDGGAVSHQFLFVNAGLAPLTIQRVTASCGCTTPEWTHEVIQPNDSGYVTLTFDPWDRPGRFNKSARVELVGEGATLVEMLDITGQVEPRAESLENRYPYHLGDVYLRATIVVFDTIIKGEVVERRLEVANATAEPQRLDFVAPEYVVIDAPTILKPNETTQITLKYLSYRNEAWGYTTGKVLLGVNGKNVGDIVVRAVLVEDFSTLTAVERLTAPIAVLSDRVLDMGDLRIGKKHTITMTLTNAGIDVLQVRAIVSGSDYIRAEVSKPRIKSGKTAKLKITVDAGNLQPYTFTKTLQLITNDPTNPSQVFSVKWQTIR